MEQVPKIIDIEKVIRSSKSKFVRSLPQFLIRYLIRSVHQDEMNRTIHKLGDHSGVSFINEVLKEWNMTIEVRGGDRIPASGKFVFVANHPVGGMDALAFMSMIHSFFPDVISPSNELFNHIPQLRPIILGVNVFGKNTRETAEKLNHLFESESQIMIFPAGEVSRRKRGVISDPPWQKTFITKSVQFKRDIIPLHISGRNSNLFYVVASLRKFLGIKLYLETALLPREMMRQKNSTITLKIGDPISWQTFTTEQTHSCWAESVKEIVYTLSDNKQ
jgi:putative hemolysin